MPSTAAPAANPSAKFQFAWPFGSGHLLRVGQRQEARLCKLNPAQLTAVQADAPEDKRLEMIKSVIEEVRPNLRRDGGDCELVSVEGSKISVKLTGACVLCKLSQRDALSPAHGRRPLALGLLPESWLPLALNLFTAACSALVLGLLARTVALLPHDPSPGGRTQSGLLATLAPRAAWMPPVLAAMACGLQSTFWEHATSATGEMIDLLLFAYIIRCLLEFRADRHDSWLTRAAFLYGAGMANNWALIVYLPLFIVAIIRLNGLQESRFIYGIPNFRFLVSLSLWTLAGLSLYLLLPGLWSLSSVHHLGFRAALKSNLRFQKENVMLFLRTGLTLLALTTFLPLLAISFRWKLSPGAVRR